MNRSRKPADDRSVRRTAHQILRRVEDGGAYSSVLLEQARAVFSDHRDKALLQELVHGVLRMRSPLDHAVERVSSRPVEQQDAAVRTALRIGAYTILYLDRIPDFAAVDTAVEIVKKEGYRSAAGFVNGVLRSIVKGGRRLLPMKPVKDDVEALAEWGSHQEWWVRRLVHRYGWDGATTILEQNNKPASTYLRVNSTRCTPAELRRAFEEEGIEVEPSGLLPDSFLLVSGRPLESGIFGEGWFYIQDEASQMVAWMFGSEGGRMIADLCAAPGGKVFQLAESAEPGAMVLAVDRHRSRLRRLALNARRLGRTELIPLLADMAGETCCLRGMFDQVLVDAPCSGSGTFRRHPEIRWRLESSDLQRLADKQLRILEHGANLLAPTGRLVYSVCSLEPEEGEQVVAAFLCRNPGMRLLDPSPALPPACRGFIGSDLMLRTTPDMGDLDGFFGALIGRAGSHAESNSLE